MVWATNNEVEVAAAQHWYGKASKEDYRQRFLESIGRMVYDNEMPPIQDTGYIDRIVLLSSPSNGEASIDPDGIDVNPQVRQSIIIMLQPGVGYS